MCAQQIGTTSLNGNSTISISFQNVPQNSASVVVLLELYCTGMQG
jgi:hypothetical protein